MAQRKPPYSSAGALDSFFDKIRTLGDPGTVDAKWAKTYGFEPALPASIPTTLRWLGVIDEDGRTQGVWNNLRPPATRAEVLAPMVRQAYHEVFDSIDVESAGREVLEATFIHAYATGDVGRPITCFLTLCRHGGISTAVEPSRSGRTSAANGGVAAKPTVPIRAKRNLSSQASRKQAAANAPEVPGVGATGVVISLAVEIPADWSTEQISARISEVKKALE
jgi:hypothetical protein